MSGRSYRVAGALIVAVAAAVAWVARGFVVGFITDPVGPRALPWLAAALLGAGGLAMAIGAPRPVAWPPGPVLRRLGAALVTLLGFALVTEPLGFVVATTLLTASMGVLFGGRARSALLVGIVVAASLFGFFAWGLGVPLPGGFWSGGP